MAHKKPTVVVGGEPSLVPAGPLARSAVDRAVTTWLHTRRAVRTRHPAAVLLAEAELMRGGVEDLPAFAAIRAPVGRRELAWVGLLADAVRELEDEERAISAGRRTHEREATVLLDNVDAAHAVLLRLAVAVGIHPRMLVLDGTKPTTALLGAERVVRVARAHLHRFPDAAVARTHIDDLAKAAAGLRTVVEAMELLDADELGLEDRAMALKGLLVEVLVWLARWGVAAVGDADINHRYQLRKLKKKKTKKEAPSPSPSPS